MTLHPLGRLGAAIASLALAAAAQREPYTPDIPRTWDDAAVADFELPLARAEYTPEHVSAEYYYRMPVRRIWRTYPVYHPDREPAGYRARLLAAEPEVAFDPAQLVTEQDWIAAGAEVFRAPLTVGPLPLRAEDLADPQWYEANAIRVTEDGIFPYARWVVREKGRLELGQFACATCHTRVMPDGKVIEGGPGTFPLDHIIARGLRKGTIPVHLPRLFSRGIADTPWERRTFAATSLAEFAAARERIPVGVLPRQGTSFTSPARIPDLIGIRERRYLDATGLVRHRGIGDVMRYAAANTGMDMLARFGDLVPATGTGERPAAGESPFPGTSHRYSDAQLLALAKFLYSLEPPNSPHPFDAEARRGEQVFADEGCRSCHPPPLYTNNRLVAAPGFDPPAGHYAKYDVMRRRVGTDPTLATETRRGTGYYKVPSLKGLWYRGPLGHGGMLARLEDWFDPHRLDADYVPTGFSPADGPRPVLGHTFGLDLSQEDRSALIAFLRTL